MEKKQNNEEVEIDLVELFFALLRRIWIIIIAAIAGAAIALLYTTLAVTPMYSSSSMIYILGDSKDVSSIINMQIGSSVTQDYEVVATSRPVLEKVISDLQLDMDYDELKSSITCTNTENTHILELKVSNPDAYMAKTIVDDLTQVVIKQTADIMESASPNIIQKGNLATTPDSPSLKKNVALGGAVGFVIAVLILSILFILDDSVKNQDDVERYLGMNTLGMIPLEEGTSKSGQKFKNRRNRIKYRKRNRK